MRRVYAFLGLEDCPVPGRLEARNAADERRKLHPVWKRLKATPVVFSVVRTLVPMALRRRLQSATMVRAASTGRFELEAAEEREILQQLAPGLRRLSSQFGIDAARKWGISA